MAVVEEPSGIEGGEDEDFEYQFRKYLKASQVYGHLEPEKCINDLKQALHYADELRKKVLETAQKNSFAVESLSYISSLLSVIETLRAYENDSMVALCDEISHYESPDSVCQGLGPSKPGVEYYLWTTIYYMLNQFKNIQATLQNQEEKNPCTNLSNFLPAEKHQIDALLLKVFELDKANSMYEYICTDSFTPQDYEDFCTARLIYSQHRFQEAPTQNHLSGLVFACRAMDICRQFPLAGSET